MIKDYYTILQIPSHATLSEIKQAYRRLAMVHHPDKNNNDPYAAAQFNEIKEAYEILANPAKKERYLQERWYDQSIGRKKRTLTITPVNILKLSLELEKYVSKLDIHRMDHHGLSNYIHELISDETIEKLKQFNEITINRQIVITLLSAVKPLHHEFIPLSTERLKKLAGNDETLLQEINFFIVRHKKLVFWDKYKTLVTVILTLLICLLIYFISK
jgi:molecular chaperone DnaJ